MLWKDSVRKAILNGPVELGGHLIRMERCRPSELVWHFQSNEEQNKIYVSNLPPKIEKQQLREIFSEVLFLFYIN